MSMLSAQRDRLRELADRFDGLAPENAALIRSAADTIWELRCKLNDEWDENAKLRELVRDWHALAVGGADSLTDWNHEQADLEQRMRELGVVE